MPGDKAAVVGVLPHGQAWTRGAPGFEHLAVTAGFGPDPLEQVKDQVLDGVGQGEVMTARQLGVCTQTIRRWLREGLLPAEQTAPWRIELTTTPAGASSPKSPPATSASPTPPPAPASPAKPSSTKSAAADATPSKDIAIGCPYSSARTNKPMSRSAATENLQPWNAEKSVVARYPDGGFAATHLLRRPRRGRLTPRMELGNRRRSVAPGRIDFFSGLAELRTSADEIGAQRHSRVSGSLRSRPAVSCLREGTAAFGSAARPAQRCVEGVEASASTSGSVCRRRTRGSPEHPVLAARSLSLPVDERGRGGPAATAACAALPTRGKHRQGAVGGQGRPNRTSSSLGDGPRRHGTVAPEWPPRLERRRRRSGLLRRPR